MEKDGVCECPQVLCIGLKLPEVFVLPKIAKGVEGGGDKSICMLMCLTIAVGYKLSLNTDGRGIITVTSSRVRGDVQATSGLKF